MDIAFIAKRYDTVGGTERDLYHLTELLTRLGHRVTVYCQEVRTTPADGVSIRKVPSLPGRTAKLWSLALLGPKMAYRSGHDLIIGFTRVLRQDIVRCGGGTHRVFLERISEAEGELKSFFKRFSPYHNSLLFIEKRQLQKGNEKVLAISDVVRKEIVSVYGVSEDSIEVIYDGIDTETFNPSQKSIYRESIRKEFGLPLDRPVILFLGNGFKRKGLGTLMEALFLLKDKDIYSLVVGGDASMKSYKEKAGAVGLKDKVVFAGPQKSPERFYAAADIFVMPSLQEAFGNSVLEAMACGLPAITTKIAGASEIMTGELADYVLADPLDAVCLSELISRLLEPGKMERLGMEARFIAKRYTVESNARGIEDLFKRVLEEKKK
ncbi:MAG TPA: glycosyltransferase family 4 protein [Candidatus Brocadiaceae bacterium]|nr:glycosyltransferase family 4 protein [Candidatus Brocadiaceae bacterium]